MEEKDEKRSPFSDEFGKGLNEADELKNSPEGSSDIEFIKEKVKERPINKKKLLKRTLLTAMMAVIFGLIACLTFLVLEPVFNNWLYPEEEPAKMQFQEEDINEEMLPEDMIVETESEEPAPPTQLIQKKELEISDYQTLYKRLYELVQDVNKSIVTVTSVTSDVDWFDNTYENTGQTSGLIVFDNGKELLILTGAEAAAEADKMQVTFGDGVQLTAELKQADANTGLAVIAVPLDTIPAETAEKIEIAVFGSSNGTNLLATPVLAVGMPMGSPNSVAYGMVTSVDRVASLTDSNYKIISTDIYGSSKASGVLVGMNGKILGIISPDASSGDLKNLVCAYGITELKQIIGKLSNGQEIACLGINGTDVPSYANKNMGVPFGAYVTGIVMDSPAMGAGIQSGDVIVKIGTEEIASFTEYTNLLLDLMPGTETTVTLMRQAQEGYQEMTLDVVLGKMN